MEKGKTVPAFWGKEDWQAIWIGGIVIVIACIAVLTKAFDFSAVKFATWTLGENLSEAAAAKVVPLGEQLGAWVFWRKFLVTFITLGALFTIGVKLQGGSVRKYVPASTRTPRDCSSLRKTTLRIWDFPGSSRTAACQECTRPWSRADCVRTAER